MWNFVFIAKYICMKTGFILHTSFTPAASSSLKVIILWMWIPDFSTANCDVADRGLWLWVRNKQLEQINTYKTKVIFAWKHITYFLFHLLFTEKQRGGKCKKAKTCVSSQREDMIINWRILLALMQKMLEDWFPWQNTGKGQWMSSTWMIFLRGSGHQLV